MSSPLSMPIAGPLSYPIAQYDGAGGIIPYRTGKVVAAGDSLTAIGTFQASTEKSVLARGWWTWAAYLLGMPFQFELATNKGTSGDSSAILLARYDADVIAQSPKTVFVCIGTNDVNNGTAAATTIANIAAILQKNRAIGAVTVLAKIPPRGSVGSPMTAPKIAAWEEINAFIAAQDARDCLVVDFEPAIGNMDAAHTIRTDCTVDNLHLSIRGAFLAGKATAERVQPAVATGNFLATTNNAVGNLLPNGFFTGTGGSLAGGATGVVASGWSASSAGAGGAAAAFSLVPRTDYGNWQQVALSGSYSGTLRNANLMRTINPSGVSDGESLKIAAEIEIDADPTALLTVRLLALDQATNLLIALGTDATYYSNGPDSAASFTIESLPFTYAVAPTYINAYVAVYLDEAADSSPVSAIVRVGRMQVVKV